MIQTNMLAEAVATPWSQPVLSNGEGRPDGSGAPDLWPEALPRYDRS